MEYAYRVRDALIELSPGESGAWRLPPMTPGVILIKSYYAMPPGWTSSTGTTTRSAPHEGRGGHGSGRHVDDVDLGAVPDASTGGTPTGGGTSHRDQPRFPHGFDPRHLDDIVIDGGGGSFGPTMELTLDLLRGGHSVKTDPNHILFQSPNSGDVWALRITRKEDGSHDRRQYRINIQYPSILPEETRRIPIGFFNRGFDENWNNNPYLEWMELKGNVLSYKWDEQFAALYDKPPDDIHVPLDVSVLSLPDMTSIGFNLSAGFAPDPSTNLIPGQTRHDRFYFALRVDFKYSGSRDVELDIPGPNPSITLPDPMWIEFRFFLGAFGQGTIGYSPKVLSPLLEKLDLTVTYPTPLSANATKTVNIKQEIEKAVEEYLYQMQLSADGVHFDKYFRPYIVGRYEVEDVLFDRNANEVVIKYVGRQKPPESRGSAMGAVTADVDDRMSEGDGGAGSGGSGGVESPLGWPRLYDTPYELPLPASGFTPDVRLEHADPGALSKIDHIVVLMQENRSFDQILGYLSRDGMLPRPKLMAGRRITRREPLQDHVNGLLPGDNTRDAIQYPEQPGSPIFRSTRMTTTAWPSFFLPNPCHGHACVERQISDGMKGFIADYARKKDQGVGKEELKLIMGYLTDAELPIFGALTREFAICDHWFCSHIGGTLPNRFISLTGDLSEDIYGSPEVENPDLAGGFAPLEATTFFDHLTKRGVSWKLFEHGYSMLRLIRNYTFDETNIVGFKDPDKGFAATARDGLPSVSFIEPDYIEAPDGNDDHAPADMINGQILVAEIMDALLNSPSWNNTLFIITYDEHGGFYDHVPLPDEIKTTVNGTPTTRRIPPLATGERRLGLRVPAFLISPLIPGMSNGKVNVTNTIYEHTTIPATILRRFCKPLVPSLSPRTSGAADVRDVLTLDTARPSSDFDGLRAEVKKMLAKRPVVPTESMPPAPLRKPKPEEMEDDFHGLIAYSSSITGMGRR